MALPNELAVEARRLLALPRVTASIFVGRHAGRAMKRSRKAGLRGEMRIVRYFRERQLARRQFGHRIVQPHAAYMAVRRDAHGERELTRKMKGAVAGNSRETCKCEVVLDVCRDIVENAAEAIRIEAMNGDSADVHAPLSQCFWRSLAARVSDAVST